MKNVRIHTNISRRKQAALIAVIEELEKISPQNPSEKERVDTWRKSTKTRKSPKDIL